MTSWNISGRADRRNWLAIKIIPSWALDLWHCANIEKGTEIELSGFV
jgi:hypothetical protein